MVLNSATVRCGRRSLASPIYRSTIRQFTSDRNRTQRDATTTTTTTTTDEIKPTANAQVSSWPTTDNSAAVAQLKQRMMITTSGKKQKALMDKIMSLATDSSHTHQGLSWAKPHVVGGEEMSPAKQWKEFKRIQKNTKTLGSELDRRYSATSFVTNPPGPEDVTLELLMASQTHMGHHKSNWNPSNSRYLYGVREDIHIISLETTAAHLRRAARVVEEVAWRGGLILIVGNRKGQMQIVTKAAQLAGACHVFNRWIPGAITNRDVILKTAGTKVVDHRDWRLENFELYANTARPLLPDLVICLNPKENYTLLYECGLKSIPTIGIIDTNADPSWVTYTIPANDDSHRSVGLIAGVLGRAGERGQKRRKADAEKGEVAWSTSPELSRHMASEVKKAVKKRKEVMGRMQHELKDFTEEEKQLLNSQYPQGEQLVINEADIINMMSQAASGEASAVQQEKCRDESAKGSFQSLTADGIEAEVVGIMEQVKVIEAGLETSEKKE